MNVAEEFGRFAAMLIAILHVLLITVFHDMKCADLKMFIDKHLKLFSVKQAYSQYDEYSESWWK